MTDVLAGLTTALADRYRIERELGQGGMATVYLAEDLRHHRRVALKVLRPELAAILGAERFLHEIRTTANLQHPHILPLHDSGQVESTVFYVMPYVEGESLRDRLNREKQLPVDDAVRIACEVAGALDYAHRHGVIHRDIKPENILLHDGAALVADFGIALAASSTGGTRMTETGMSLGTPHYMSPEQAMGDRDISGRSDVYALGVVLYEMLTGDPPFTGSTAQAIVARVMTEEPRSLTLQRRTIPPHIEAAVLTALQKLPADRFASGAQFAEALSKPDFAGTRATAARVAATRPRTRAAAALPWALLVIAMAAAMWGWLRSKPAASGANVVASSITLPDSAPLTFVGTASFGIGKTALALTPDGTTLVYVAERGASTQLYLRPMDRDTVIPIPGTEGACCPTISTDGTWLAFVARDQLYRMRVGLPGAPIPVSSVNSFTGAEWGDDGSIVMSDMQGRETHRINLKTGAREALTPTRGPFKVLPGNRGILAENPWNLTAAFNLAGGKAPRPLPVPGTDRRFAPSGHIVYLQRGALWAVPFDLSTLTVTGEPVSVEPHVRSEGWIGYGQYTFARNGLLVYASGSAGDVGRLVQRQRSGRVDTLPFPAARFGCFELSPDGKRIATRIADPVTDQWDLWVYDLATGNTVRLTNTGGAYCPSWTPDGRISYVIRSGSESIIWSQSPSGRESPVRLAQVKVAVGSSANRWSPDGKRVAMNVLADSLGVQSDLDVVEIDSPATARPLANTPALEWGAIFSPDGRWVAYSSNETGGDEIYVQPWPTTGQRYRISRNGGEEPLWTRGGREVVYRSGQEWWAVDVNLAGQFSASEPTLVTRGPYLNVSGVEYAVSSDGERFLFLAPAGGAGTTTRLNVISNWFSVLTDLTRQAPHE